jgi:TolB-like protein
MALFEELKRRNVVKVAMLYIVASWLILQVGDVLFDTFELPPSWLRGVLALLILGFPVAMILSWVYEMTPEGIKLERDVDRSQSITSETGRKINVLIVVLLVLAIAAVVVDRLIPETTAPTEPAVVETPTATPAPDPAHLAAAKFTPAQERSIAVLPFASRSAREEDTYFVDGIHDDILTQLSKLSALDKVISRTSTERYRGTTKSMVQIGQELGVANILEGGVQRAGNRVRINVQLIDATSDKHLWAETYDRELTAENIFDIQSEITKSVASALNAVLSNTDELALQNRPTENLQAYDAYLNGRLQIRRFYEGEERFRRAIAAFDRAIALDPDFAEAYADRAYAQVALYWYTAAEGDWLKDADESLRRAEALAPDAVETLTARGHYYYWGFLDYGRADVSFARALEIAPNYVDALNGKAFAARRDGRYDEAVTLLERSHRFDPLNSDAASSLAETFAELGRFDDAQRVIARAEALGAGQGVDPTTASIVWERQGDTERAWQAIMQDTDLPSANTFAYRVQQAIATRDPANIQRALDGWPEAMRRPGVSPEAYEISRARALLALGRTDEAQALLREIKARIDAATDPYAQGWKANAFYYPVTLPGLMGDLDGVRAAVADYEANAKPDAWRESGIYHDFARAFVQAGDPDTAFEYIGRLVALRGPWVYLPLSTDVALDPIRDDPRYLKLKGDYEAWAAETG